MFPGMYPFIEAAAEKLSFTDGTYIGKAKNLWHTSQIQCTLGAMAGVPEYSKDNRLGMLKHVCHVRQSLVVALQAVDDAIANAVTEYDLPKPDWMNTNGTNEPENSGLGHERNDLGSIEDGGRSTPPEQSRDRKRGKS